MNVTDDKSSRETKGSIWHRRYGYLGARNLEELFRHDIVDGFDHNSSRESASMNHAQSGRFIVASFHRVADVVRRNLA